MVQLDGQRSRVYPFALPTLPGAGAIEKPAGSITDAGRAWQSIPYQWCTALTATERAILLQRSGPTCRERTAISKRGLEQRAARGSVCARSPNLGSPASLAGLPGPDRHG
ncbi:hypothetical protein trd_A0316 (plasmid) [Thermomicrobium roseum DSM 5159]|uniref:Uncharacterized protein n=1 Tax=Thermomicrobium roseum (strain ATCC 27502 / DSM 5159 / P-2) TaxID=309801 RepID=B9L3F2_THERP|nr:hypothetical protein trd_A0316 [Thermomicrobium roseum DSM 5159]